MDSTVNKQELMCLAHRHNAVTPMRQGGTSFVDLLCFCSVLCLLCLCARLFKSALWSSVGKALTSWLSFVVSYCEFVIFPLVSWFRCGT